MTPGGASSAQSAQSASSSSSPSGGQQQINQVVLPNNSDVRTVIVPPCVPATSASASEQGAGKSNVLQAAPKTRTVTAPTCLVQASSSSSSSGG